MVPPGAAPGWVRAGHDEAGQARDAPAHAAHSKSPSRDTPSLAGVSALAKEAAIGTNIYISFQWISSQILRIGSRVNQDGQTHWFREQKCRGKAKR